MWGVPRIDNKIFEIEFEHELFILGFPDDAK